MKDHAPGPAARVAACPRRSAPSTMRRTRRTHRGSSPCFFHSRCGCPAGQPVEKYRNRLMALRCARAANFLASRRDAVRARKALRRHCKYASPSVMATRQRRVRAKSSPTSRCEQNFRSVCMLQRGQTLECLFHRLTRGTSTAPVENITRAQRHRDGRCMIPSIAQRFFRRMRLRVHGENFRSACATQCHQSVAVLFHRLARKPSTRVVENASWRAKKMPP